MLNLQFNLLDQVESILSTPISQQNVSITWGMFIAFMILLFVVSKIAEEK